jgi:hypothetical protein
MNGSFAEKYERENGEKWGLRKNPTARNPATMQPVAQFMGLWIFMQLVA